MQGKAGSRSGANAPGVREIDQKIETLQSARAILAADSGGRGYGSASSTRGGARPGAGRPKGSTNDKSGHRKRGGSE